MPVAKVALPAWRVEHLRVSLFYPVPQVSPLGGLWREIRGEDPETVSSQPKLMMCQEQGPVDRGILFVQRLADRVDCLLAPDQRLLATSPTVGSWHDVTPWFLDMLRPWLGQAASRFKRLAFGAVLALPVPSREVGYQQISAYLPFHVDAATSSDFLYQINRRRRGRSMPALEFNRLSKWSVSAQQFTSLSPMMLGVASPPVLLGEVRHACRLELDISTDASYAGDFGGPDATLVLAELADLAQEIAEKGDVA